MAIPLGAGKRLESTWSRCPGTEREGIHVSGSDTSVTCIDVEFDRRAVGATSLASALSDHQPEVTLWNIGATSTLTLRRCDSGTPNVAVLTSPRYSLAQMLRLAPAVLREPSSYGIHAVLQLIERRVARYLRIYFVRQTLVPGQSFRRPPPRCWPPGRRGVTRGPRPGVTLHPFPLRMRPRAARCTLSLEPAIHCGADLAIRALAGVVSADDEDDPSQSDRPAGPPKAISKPRRSSRSVEDRGPRRGHRGGAGSRTVSSRAAGAGRHHIAISPGARASWLVILEASGAGKPLIPTGHACIEDLASPGAVLVSPDDGSELTRAMVRLASDQGSASDLGPQPDDGSRIGQLGIG